MYLLAHESKKWTRSTDFFLTICLSPKRNNNFIERLSFSMKKFNHRKFYGNYIRFSSNFRDEWLELLSTYFVLFENLMFGDDVEIDVVEPYRDEKSTATMCMIYGRNFGSSKPSVDTLESVLPPIIPKENYKPRTYAKTTIMSSASTITKLFLEANTKEKLTNARRILDIRMQTKALEGHNPHQVRAGVRAAVTRAGGDPKIVD